MGSSSTSSPLDIYIVSFNCARTPLDVEAFASTLFLEHRARNELPDLVVFALQEVAPLAHSFLSGTWVSPWFTPYYHALQKAAGSALAYNHFGTHNVGMTACMLFARADLADSLKWLQTGEVGLGWAQAGNKGAVAMRVGWKSPSMPHVVPLTFVAAHLAPTEDQCRRRNEDWENMVRRLMLKPLAADTIKLSTAVSLEVEDEDDVPLLDDVPEPAALTPDAVSPVFTSWSPVFLAGDLNYRTSDAGPAEDAVESYPQPRQEVSDPLHYSHFLARDQLTRERKAGRTLHQLQEMPIAFAPTYKFSSRQQKSMTRRQLLSNDEPAVYYWAPHRFPSWCDRVLFSSALEQSRDFEALRYGSLAIQPTSDHRPVALSLRLNVELAAKATAGQSSPFRSEPTWQSSRAAGRRVEITVGALAYLALTRPGNALVVAGLMAVVGAWIVLGSLLAPNA